MLLYRASPKLKRNKILKSNRWRSKSKNLNEDVQRQKFKLKIKEKFHKKREK